MTADDLRALLSTLADGEELTTRELVERQCSRTGASPLVVSQEVLRHKALAYRSELRTPDRGPRKGKPTNAYYWRRLPATAPAEPTLAERIADHATKIAALQHRLDRLQSTIDAMQLKL